LSTTTVYGPVATFKLLIIFFNVHNNQVKFGMLLFLPFPYQRTQNSRSQIIILNLCFKVSGRVKDKILPIPNALKYIAKENQVFVMPLSVLKSRCSVSTLVPSYIYPEPLTSLTPSCYFSTSGTVGERGKE
jgi:hypothetical protein